MSNRTKIIICISVGLCGFGILINGLYNKSVPKKQIEVQITSESTIPSTTSTATTKTTKKVVKTTKKATKKKTNKSQKFKIKYNLQEVIDYTHQEVVRRWGEEQWEATYKLVMHESGFNPNNVNKKSGACGIFQANPCSKTIKNGYKDYYTNWKTQVIWGLDWIMVHKRYGTPKKAWAYWQKHHSY